MCAHLWFGNLLRQCESCNLYDVCMSAMYARTHVDKHIFQNGLGLSLQSLMQLVAGFVVMDVISYYVDMGSICGSVNAITTASLICVIRRSP